MRRPVRVSLYTMWPLYWPDSCVAREWHGAPRVNYLCISHGISAGGLHKLLYTMLYTLCMYKHVQCWGPLGHCLPSTCCAVASAGSGAPNHMTTVHVELELEPPRPLLTAFLAHLQ